MIRCLLELRREKVKPFHKDINRTVEKIFIISHKQLYLYFLIIKCLFILISFVSFTGKCSGTNIMGQAAVNWFLHFWIGGRVLLVCHSPEVLGWFSKPIMVQDLWVAPEALGGCLLLILASGKVPGQGSFIRVC